MTMWQIGTAEPRGVVGSRAARAATSLEEALAECARYSRARHVREAWLREYSDGKLGPVIASFRKGVRQ